MARRPLSDAELVQVSTRCAELLASEGVEVPGADLAKAAGMSERTFFRYFPTKADCVRPVLDQGYRLLVEEFEEQSTRAEKDATILEIIRDAFVNVFEQHPIPGDGDFLATLLANMHYRRVWLEINDDLQESLAPAMARVLDQDQDSLHVRVAAAEATTFAVTTVMEMVRTGGPLRELAHAVHDAFVANPTSGVVNP